MHELGLVCFDLHYKIDLLSYPEFICNYNYKIHIMYKYYNNNNIIIMYAVSFLNSLKTFHITCKVLISGSSLFSDHAHAQL